MTTVSRERAPGLSTNQVKILIVALALAIGVGVGLGLAQMLDRGGSDATASFEGPTVERSLAMERNHAALIAGGKAHGHYLGTAGDVYRGPMVEHSLAMERNHAALIKGGLAQSKYLD